MAVEAVEPKAEVKSFLNGAPKKLLIAGQWVEALEGGTFEVINPSDESVLASVQRGGAADIERAVKAARKSFEEGTYRRMSVHERSKLLFKLSDLIERMHKLSALGFDCRPGHWKT